jgi:hypothetical protein
MPSFTSVKPNTAFFLCDDDIAHGREPGATPERGAVNTPDQRNRQRIQGRKHRAAALASRTLSSCVYASAFAIHAMSAPAEKTLPAPPDHRERDVVIGIDGGAQGVSSAIICSLNALRTSGTVQREVFDDAVAATLECGELVVHGSTITSETPRTSGVELAR